MAVWPGLECESIGGALGPDHSAAGQIKWALCIGAVGNQLAHGPVGDRQFPNLPGIAGIALAGKQHQAAVEVHVGVRRRCKSRQQRLGFALMHEKQLRTLGKALLPVQLRKRHVDGRRSHNEIRVVALHERRCTASWG